MCQQTDLRRVNSSLFFAALGLLLVSIPVICISLFRSSFEWPTDITYFSYRIKILIFLYVACGGLLLYATSSRMRVFNIHPILSVPAIGIYALPLLIVQVSFIKSWILYIPLTLVLLIGLMREPAGKTPLPKQPYMLETFSNVSFFLALFSLFLFPLSINILEEELQGPYKVALWHDFMLNYEIKASRTKAIENEKETKPQLPAFTNTGNIFPPGSLFKCVAGRSFRFYTEQLATDLEMLLHNKRLLAKKPEQVDFVLVVSLEPEGEPIGKKYAEEHGVNLSISYRTHIEWQPVAVRIYVFSMRDDKYHASARFYDPARISIPNSILGLSEAERNKIETQHYMKYGTSKVPKPGPSPLLGADAEVLLKWLSSTIWCFDQG